MNLFDDEEREAMLKTCQRLMAKPRLKQLGLTYLEFEEIRIRELGVAKEWRMFGSPVSQSRISYADA